MSLCPDVPPVVVIPEISTVPPVEGLIPCGLVVTIVTTLFVRTAPTGPAAIVDELSFDNRFTTVVLPDPPGVTYANGTFGCMITCGVGPVVSETEAMTHGAT